MKKINFLRLGYYKDCYFCGAFTEYSCPNCHKALCGNCSEYHCSR